MSLTCNRSGCGLSFDPANNPAGSCTFHPGAPKFHEGLKSWDCCSDINRPVMEFDDFVKIKGCTQSTHLAKPTATQAPSPPAPSAEPTPSKVSSTGVETYGASSTPSLPPAPSALPTAPSVPASEQPEEEDDPSLLPPPPQTTCKRKSCGQTYTADGQDSECWYHPGFPVFREGSKGYTCCKRRTLEFDEFLRIQGCRLGKAHLWVGPKPKEVDASAERELVNARLDHYQTPTQVHVSVFAKSVDKTLSKITLEEQAIHLDLLLPQHKRTLKTINLFGPINVEECKVDILGTKVAITLQKANGLSWSLLETPSNGAAPPPGYALTFGVGGRTGSTGAKEMVLADEVRKVTL